MTQPVCREQLIKEDVVWVLIKLAAADDSNDDTRSVCGRAICSLSYNPKGCVKLLEHKAIPAIYTLCRDGDAKTKRYASITLSNLSAYGATHNLVGVPMPSQFRTGGAIVTMLCADAGAGRCELLGRVGRHRRR